MSLPLGARTSRIFTFSINSLGKEVELRGLIHPCSSKSRAMSASSSARISLIRCSARCLDVREWRSLAFLIS